MKAMILKGVFDLKKEREPLEYVDVEAPMPGEGQIVIKILSCGVCHTELDEIEGRTPPEQYPVIPGHQVIGHVVEMGKGCHLTSIDDRVGVAWIFDSCGFCRLCRTGLENLCSSFKATGRDVNGGYAEFMVVSENFVYQIPEVFPEIEAAPLLCAGAIGYRSVRLCDLEGKKVLGLAGFGASAHLVLKMIGKLYPDVQVIVMARSETSRRLATELGAVWTGDFGEVPPLRPQAIIDTTPAWKPVMDSLAVLERGGRLVINAIRKEADDAAVLSSIDYTAHLWQEKEIKSVANVTRRDVRDFLSTAAEIPLKPKVQLYNLREANAALQDLKNGGSSGAKVLVMD